MSVEKKIDYKKLPFFRFKKLGKKYLLSNDVGDYVTLSKVEFDKFLHNQIAKKSALYKKLHDSHFIKEEICEDCFAAQYADRKNFLIAGGPSLHIVVVTLRCNQHCVYCHASAKGEEVHDIDMTVEMADKALDIIFASTSPFIAIEFQGGEPLLNWPVVEYLVKEAQVRNVKAKKELDIRLISNFILLNEERYKFLIENRVSLCTSLDGPRELHDRNRPYTKGSSHEIASKWIERMNKEYPELLKTGYIWKPGAITTVSKFSLEKPQEIVDEYLKFGYDRLFLRQLNPFGFSKKAWKIIGYTSDDYVEFYKKALDYIIEINKNGQKFIERTAKFYLDKIFTDTDPNNFEVRSPCGAGIGQVAYNFDGDIYTCDEGRMLSVMGDKSFKIGNVFESSYEDIVTHTVTKSLCTASCLDSLPGCSDCAYLPYCGVCPIYNYFEQGNIYGQMPNNERCKISMSILDYIFVLLEDEEKKKILASWVFKK